MYKHRVIKVPISMRKEAEQIEIELRQIGHNVEGHVLEGYALAGEEYLVESKSQVHKSEVEDILKQKGYKGKFINGYLTNVKIGKRNKTNNVYIIDTSKMHSDDLSNLQLELYGLVTYDEMINLVTTKNNELILEGVKDPEYVKTNVERFKVKMIKSKGISIQHRLDKILKYSLSDDVFYPMLREVEAWVDTHGPEEGFWLGVQNLGLSKDNIKEEYHDDFDRMQTYKTRNRISATAGARGCKKGPGSGWHGNKRGHSKAAKKGWKMRRGI